VGKFLIVGIGGFTEAIARFGLAMHVGHRMGTPFPCGSFIINMSGSFLIGMTMTMLTEKGHLSPNWRYLLPTTFEYETLRVVQDGQLTAGVLNLSLSVIVGFAMVWLGFVVGRAVS
jgi:fluoride exporter